MLRFQASVSIFVAIVLLKTVLFQATGKVTPAFCCSLSRQGIIYVIVLYIAVKVAGYTGLLASQCLADVISAAMGLMLYKLNFK